MKLRSVISLSHQSRPTHRAGFTLAEVAIALGIFSVGVLAAIYLQVFGMKMFSVSATKLRASEGARTMLNHIQDEIRSAKILYVGSGDGVTFNSVAPGSPYEGNAVQVYPTADTNHFVQYFLDATDQRLKRKSSDSDKIELIATCITNQIVFQAEDYAGNVLTNEPNSRVLKLTLDFYQWEFPVAELGAGAHYDHYRLQTRITRRAIE
jgi:prepilin-type N-terminal cleavage/methylation domain-containing protein